jgi:D-sedoheptulose 7-phosphate isomerase
MKTINWLDAYIEKQKNLLDSLSRNDIKEVIDRFGSALRGGNNIFVFGNGGSAANSSHFVTDIGKSASDKLGQRFSVISLNDNVSWMTALANDYAYEEVFAGQLRNYAKKGDIAMTLSVSGNSPNCVSGIYQAKNLGLYTVALVGGKRGKLAEIADKVLVINDEHYGRVEDIQMSICHMVAYSFIENPHSG